MAEFSMDQFEQDYRNERRKALRDSVKSGKTSLPVGILQHGANRIGEGFSDTVQGIGAFAKSLYNNPKAVAESGAEGLEALYTRVAQEDPMAAMQVAQMVASGGTGAAILRGGRIDPSAVGSGGGNIIRGFHSTRKDFDEIDPERGLPTGNFGQAAYFSESNDYPSRLNPNSRIIESNLDTTDFLQAGQRTPIAKERVLGTLSVLNSLKDATGKPFKVEYDVDTNTARVEYSRRKRSGEEGPVTETKTFDFNNSSDLFRQIKSVTWGLRSESMSTDKTNLSDFMRAAGFTGVKGGSDDDFHIGVFDKKAIKNDKPEVVTPKTIFDNPNVQYVSTAEIADKVAQFNLPRYDVGKFGGRFESGNMGENPLKQLAFDKSKRQTLKENINDEGIKEPIEIEVALSNGDLSIGDGHHRLQAAIELGLSEVPVVIKTVTNPRSKAFEAVGPAKVDTSGLSAGKEYSFSEFNLKERFLTPKQTAQELREQGRSVFENLKTGEISDRRFPESYTPMREGYYKKFAQGGPVMRGIGTLNETARNMFRGPRGIGAYQQFAGGGEANRELEDFFNDRSQNEPPPARGLPPTKSPFGDSIRNFEDTFSKPQGRGRGYFDDVNFRIDSYEIDGKPSYAIEFDDGFSLFEPQIIEMMDENNSANEPIPGERTRKELFQYLFEKNPTSEEFFRYLKTTGLASGGEVSGPPPTRGPDPQGIGYFQQFADGGPVYMKEGGEVITPDDIAGMREKIMNDYGFDPEDVAVQEGVPPELFLRLLFKENRGRQGPKSPKGAIGLAQLMPATAKELGVDPTVPYENAVGGARYLKQKIAEFDGDVLLGLAAYNAGAGNVRKYEGVPPFAETQDYVAVILGEGYSGGTSLSETIRKEQGFAPSMSYEGLENDVREEQGLVPISMASSGTAEGVGSLMRQESSAPETSLRPVLRPTAPSTSLRPVLRPTAPSTSLRPVLRGQDQPLREKYAPENFEKNLLSPDAFQYFNGLGVMEREGKKQGIETLDPRGIRRINNFAMERSTMA